MIKGQATGTGNTMHTALSDSATNRPSPRLLPSSPFLISGSLSSFTVCWGERFGLDDDNRDHISGCTASTLRFEARTNIFSEIMTAFSRYEFGGDELERPPHKRLNDSAITRHFQFIGAWCLAA